jgi:hypothetical protein
MLTLRWTMDNKLRQAQNGSRFVRYWYDASGQRVMKRLHGDTAEYIIRDGTGNELLRTTRRNNSTASPVLVRTEANVYGASRIGVHELPMPTTPPQPDTMETRASSRYNYEITDHLGNVRVTVGDVKTFVVSSPGYRLDALVRSANDMYPYGMPISTRTFSAPSFYRFGFNTQEKSIELNSGGNITTALFWEYDSRIGRRWNLDPVDKPWASRYHTLSNSPLSNSDPNGDCDNCPKVGAQASATVTLGTRGQSSFKLNVGFGIFKTQGPLMAGLNFSGNLYNGGLGTNQGYTNNNSLQGDLVVSPSLTYGSGTGTPTPLNTFNRMSLSGVSNAFDRSVSVSTNFVFNTDGRHQRVGAVGLKIDGTNLNMYNDYNTGGVLTDGNDRWWSGGGQLSQQFGNGTSVTFGTEVFTGERTGLAENGYNRFKGRGGHTFYKMSPGGAYLTNGQTFLQVNSASGISAAATVTGRGSFMDSMWSQNAIHSVYKSGGQSLPWFNSVSPQSFQFDFSYGK